MFIRASRFKLWIFTFCDVVESNSQHVLLIGIYSAFIQLIKKKIPIRSVLAVFWFLVWESRKIKVQTKTEKLFGARIRVLTHLIRAQAGRWSAALRRHTSGPGHPVALLIFTPTLKQTHKHTEIVVTGGSLPIQLVWFNFILNYRGEQNVSRDQSLF